MKKIIVWCIAALVLGAGITPAAAARKPLTVGIAGSGEARVQLLEGTAWVMEQGKQPRRAVHVNDLLVAGDEIQTGPKAKMECRLPDDSVVRFAENARFTLARIEGGPVKPRSVRVQMAVGRTWANVTKTIGGGSFEIASQNAVTGVRGTVYHLNVHEDDSVLVRVYDGTIAVTGGGRQAEAPAPIGPPRKIAGPTPVPGPHKVSMEEWTVIVRSMQQVFVRSDGTAEQPRDFTDEEDRDPWVDWNRSRDAEVKGQ